MTLLVFGSVYISPENFPYVGLLPFFIPVAWLFNLFLFIILALSWRKLSFVPLSALLIGYRFAEITFQLNDQNKESEGL
ncbi:MAG TPA: endonuclease, partial [Algoriphagus sp.]|nr:endonuclease [Algoriphagus sp.]